MMCNLKSHEPVVTYFCDHLVLLCLIGKTFGPLDIIGDKRGEEIRTMPTAPSYLIPGGTWIIAMY